MSQRNTVKSYCKVAAVDNRNYVDVPFKDTGGTVIHCNWFRVDCSANTGGEDETGGFYVVQPSSVYTGTLSSTEFIFQASGSITDQNLHGSGMGGVIGIAGEGRNSSVEMSLATDRRAPGLRIWNLTGGRPHALFAITYGNVKHANPLRDNDPDHWPVGN